MEVKKIKIPIRNIAIDRDQMEGLEASWASSRSLRLSRKKCIHNAPPNISTMIKRLNLVYQNRRYNTSEHLKSPLRSTSCLIPNVRPLKENHSNYKCFPKRSSLIRCSAFKVPEVKCNPIIERNLQEYFSKDIAFLQSVILSEKPGTSFTQRYSIRNKSSRIETALTSKTERVKHLKNITPFCPWEEDKH